MAESKSGTVDSMARTGWFGLLVVFLLIAGLGGWGAYASISGAVVASGRIVVASNVKRIQHREGGIVRQIHVKDGNFVKTGDLLVSLDNTLPAANFTIIVNQLAELSVRSARLQAGIAGADRFTIPKDNAFAAEASNFATMVRQERNLFEAQRRTTRFQTDQLRKRIQQTRDEVIGLNVQEKAKSEEIALIRQELVGSEGLHEKGHVPITRILALKRQRSRLAGERGELVARIARAGGRIAETELQISELHQSKLEAAVKELREVRARTDELREHLVAAEDQLKRVEIRAPQQGFVHKLSLHTIGGVIEPGSELMQIVPNLDALVVEARISPTDIDQISLGQPATVRLSAFNQRETPEFRAKIVRISADLAIDEKTGAPHYLVRAALDEGEINKLAGKTLVPGMPAEVFFETASRTAMSYVLKPLSDQVQRAFREE